MTKTPNWVYAESALFLDTEPRWDEDWHKDNAGQYSKVVSIHYPTAVSVYYTVDALRPEHQDSVNGWYNLGQTYMSEELASSVAKNRAYHEQVPYRVRIVVWNG